MLTRRDLTKLAGLGAATARLPSISTAQEQNAPSLPAPIAQLKSRKAEAKPIAIEERQQRQERARQLMRENNLDAILMIGGTSLVYFTNIRWWNSERLFAAVLPAKGNAFYVCPAFEEDRARAQIASGHEGNNADVRTCEEDEDPSRPVAARPNAAGLG